MIYVLYHTACYDGFGAAFAAWKKFGNKAKYLPVGYGHPMPAIPNAEEVYIVDFSYDEETLLGLTHCGVKVTVLDHHKTAEEKLRNLLYQQDCNQNPKLYIEFDMNRSGAGIAWDYFHGPASRPKMIDLIEDRDLWKFKQGDTTKRLHSYLLSQPFKFDVYEQLLDPANLEAAIVEGAALDRMTNSIVDKICKNARLLENFLGHKAVVVNVSSHWSEVGNRLLELFPEAEFACAYTDLRNDMRMFSLRSTAPFDVSKVAAIYGGGGHAQAAGFKAKLQIPFESVVYENVTHGT